MNEPCTVAVMGSCISRDNFNQRFNADYRRWFQVGACTNQSSMIALMAPPVTRSWEPTGKLSSYDLWNVSSDLSREILPLLAEAPPDVLVLDFFGDVHFGVLQAEDGSVVTNNRWKLWKTDLHAELLAEPTLRTLRWQDDPDGYFELWSAAMDRFAAHLREHCPQTLVVVHHGFNTHQRLEQDGVGIGTLGNKPPQKHAPWTRRANRFWARLDQHATTAYGWSSITLRDEWYATYADHPWGPFYVHYTPDYYHRFMAELHALAVAAANPSVADEIDRLRMASRERTRTEAEFWLGLHASAGQSPAGWRRFARRRPSLKRPAIGTGPDHDLLRALTGRVSDENLERLAQLPASADEHISWLRRVWQPRIERARHRAGH